MTFKSLRKGFLKNGLFFRAKATSDEALTLNRFLFGISISFVIGSVSKIVIAWENTLC